MNVRDSPPEVMLSLLSPTFRVLVGQVPLEPPVALPPVPGLPPVAAPPCRSCLRSLAFRPSLSRRRYRCSPPVAGVPPVPTVPPVAVDPPVPFRCRRSRCSRRWRASARASRSARRRHAPGAFRATGTRRSAGAVITARSGGGASTGGSTGRQPEQNGCHGERSRGREAEMARRGHGSPLDTEQRNLPSEQSAVLQAELSL